MPYSHLLLEAANVALLNDLKEAFGRLRTALGKYATLEPDPNPEEMKEVREELSHIYKIVHTVVLLGINYTLTSLVSKPVEHVFMRPQDLGSLLREQLLEQEEEDEEEVQILSLVRARKGRIREELTSRLDSLWDHGIGKYVLCWAGLLLFLEWIATLVAPSKADDLERIIKPFLSLKVSPRDLKTLGVHKDKAQKEYCAKLFGIDPEKASIDDIANGFNATMRDLRTSVLRIFQRESESRLKSCVPFLRRLKVGSACVFFVYKTLLQKFNTALGAVKLVVSTPQLIYTVVLSSVFPTFFRDLFALGRGVGTFLRGGA